MYIRRHLEGAVLEAARHYPVVMVCGQRQVGKSTMLHHLKEPERRYVTLDDANARRLAETDPALFFEAYPAPLLIDEFQRVPSLLLEIKRVVDAVALNGGDNGGMFWLTGSQKFTMMKGVVDSLAGRVAVFEMLGLSSAEIEDRPAGPFSPELDAVRERLRHSVPKDTRQVYEAIFRGSMPKVIATDIDRERYYMDYVNTYLEKDIRDLSQVGKLREFYDFLVAMAARTAQELRYSDIAGAVGVSAPTVKEWVSLLECSGVLYLLRPYHSNITSRLVKMPKAYFMDTGLAAHLCRWPNAETLERGAMDGALLETWAVTEIIKGYYNAGMRPNLYYYRDTDKREIDLLLLEGQKAYPIEIKKGREAARADRHFGVLDRFPLDVRPGLVLCMATELLPLSRRAWLCPLSAL